MEDAGPALVHRPDAFLEVVGRAQDRLFLELVAGLGADGGGEVAAQGLLGGDHGERRVLGDLLGQGLSGGQEREGLADLVDQAPGQGLVRLDAPGGEIHQVRPLLADQPGQGVGEAEARVEAQLDEVGDEPGLRRGDAEVGDEGQAQPRADRRALHGGDDGLFDREQPHRLVVERADGVHPLGPDAAGRGEVGPGAEHLAGGGQHNGAHAVVVVQPLHLVGQRLHQFDADVIVRRPVDGDRGHEALAFDFDFLVAHRVPPIRLRATTMRWTSLGPS